MVFIEKRRSWQNLIAVFISVKDGFKSADVQLKNGVDDFCLRLTTENIIHSSKNTSGTSWKAKSLIVCFCETFDPILIQIFPPNFFTFDYLTKNQIGIPLSSYLVQKESCKELSNNIKNSIIALEKLSPFENTSVSQLPSVNRSEWPRLQKDTESLELLARLLSAMHQELGLHDEMNWCSICFRRANNAGNYCDLHGTTQDDTNYRLGLRIKKSIAEEDYDKFLRLRSKRKALKDDVMLLSNDKDMPNEITYKTNCIYVDKPIKKLVQDTLTQDWQLSSGDWNLVLQTVPHVNKRLHNKANDFTSWNQFVKSTLVALDNNYEKTLHPYWIIQMLAEAEIWFEIEKSLLQEKSNSKKDQIRMMIAQGLRNRDIVNQLGVSNSYISQLKKEYNKKRTTNLSTDGGAANKKSPQRF